MAQRVLDETDERYPIFRGTLPSDITFLGFNLSLDDARGGTPQSPEGFFFVFQQQPSEPRFGLEPNEDATPIAHWAELAWTNFDLRWRERRRRWWRFSSCPISAIPPVERQSHNSPWRLSSQVFSDRGAECETAGLPELELKPVRVSHSTRWRKSRLPDYSPDDPNNNWGVNSAQTAYILLRLPFRILIHADLMLPPS